jgi:hypothetical protein
MRVRTTEKNLEYTISIGPELVSAALITCFISFQPHVKISWEAERRSTTSSFTILRRALPAEKIAFTLAEVLIAL